MRTARAGPKQVKRGFETCTVSRKRNGSYLLLHCRIPHGRWNTVWTCTAPALCGAHPYSAPHRAMTTWSAHVDVEIVAAATAPSAAAAAPAPSAAAAKKARPAPMNMLSPARVVRQSSAKPPKVGFTTSFLKDKPWLAVQHVAERKMWSLRRKRLEFTVRMGVIYALTTLYAVANAIRNSSAFGTYPVLANFYATFTLMPTIGCSVLSALEMCRGCVYGYALALAVVEITLAVDASTGNEVGSVWLLALLLLLTTVFTVVAPLFTLEEKKMLLFSVVNAGYNGHDRVRKRHDPSYTLNARYDTWYHPLLELLSCVMGFLIALAICFFPYGMWAISELRGRIEFQASQISALLRTQHFVARTNSAIGISESKQIADALRNNQQQMRGLMSDALYEIAHRGANLKRLHDTFHHFEGQLPLLLAKGLFVEGRLDDGNVTEQAEQIEFLAIVDASWLALEDAIDEANSEVVAAERDRHAILPTVWSNLEDRLLKFRQATDLARQRAIYGRTSEVTNELIERHKRRMCHLAVVEQHALRVLASKDAVYRDAATWTLSRAVRLVFELLFVVSTSRRTWKQASSGHGGLSKASLVESAKMVVSMAVCMCMHFVPQLRTSEFVSGQGCTRRPLLTADLPSTRWPPLSHTYAFCFRLSSLRRHDACHCHLRPEERLRFLDLYQHASDLRQPVGLHVRAYALVAQGRHLCQSADAVNPGDECIHHRRSRLGDVRRRRVRDRAHAVGRRVRPVHECRRLPIVHCVLHGAYHCNWIRAGAAQLVRGQPHAGDHHWCDHLLRL